MPTDPAPLAVLQEMDFTANSNILLSGSEFLYTPHRRLCNHYLFQHPDCIAGSAKLNSSYAFNSVSLKEDLFFHEMLFKQS